MYDWLCAVTTLREEAVKARSRRYDIYEQPEVAANDDEEEVDQEEDDASLLESEQQPEAPGGESNHEESEATGTA
jgi:hypothetical protein